MPPGPTPFGTWITAHGLTYERVGALLGIGRAFVSELATGRKTPSLALAARIERVTDGEVPMQSWVPWLPA